MEDTLRGSKEDLKKVFKGLNPCFNGRYSQSKGWDQAIEGKVSLNPCFNGRYSQSQKQQEYGKSF